MPETLLAGGRRAPLRPQTSQFEAEMSAYVQRRLCLLTGILALGSTLVFIINSVVDVAVHDGDLAHLHLDELRVHLHLLLCVASFGLRLFLGKGRRPSATLRRIDAATFYLVAIVALGISLVVPPQAQEFVVACIALFIIMRSVIVPSSARRTFWLALPAPLALLVAQTVGGDSPDRVEAPMDAFPLLVMRNQILLWLSIWIAAVASRITFQLRRQVYESKRLGPYEIGEKIGEGAMGEVYRATHALLKRPTALKFLRPEITGRQALQRFEHEVQQTSRLTHANTVSIFDYGHTADGVFYYAMELLNGLDLGEVVRLSGPLPPARTIHVLVQACGALHEAHAKGLIHRDIKPGNVILCEQGGELDVVKLVDFGLVKNLEDRDPSLTLPGAMVGTPETVSPEALTGGPVTAPSDLYSLGAVGYFMLTGQNIFDASTTLEFLDHHRHTDPIPPRERDPSLPEDLEQVILRCLAKDPRARPRRADALRSDLLSCRDAGQWTRTDATAWWETAAEDSGIQPFRPQ
jgi:serine/threonine-protein kinase